MNESELKQYCLEHAGEELPAEAQALLSRDAELNRQVDELITVQKLISLKRYEMPSADSLERCIQGVNERIGAGQSGGFVIRILEWFDVQPGVARFAYAAAALVVCALGVNLFVNDQASTVLIADELIAEPVVSEVNAVAEVEPDDFNEMLVAVTEVETNPVVKKPIIVLHTNSSPRPGSSGMTIGGGQVLPVSFER